MFNHEDRIRIRHMLDASQKVIKFIDGKTRQEFENEEVLVLAVLRLLEMIGEAAKKISPETSKEFTRIPWKGIIGTRDRLIHGHFHVDMNVIWNIIEKDLPYLIKELMEVEKIIGESIYDKTFLETMA